MRHNHIHRLWLTAALLMLWAGVNPASAAPPPNTLWYDKPAAAWVEALPIGNGRLGAMIYGGVPLERIQLNEDTIWAGGPYDPNNPAAFEAYQKARPLILAGKQAEATEILKVDGLGKPSRQCSYQTVGELTLTLPAAQHISNYRRSLDLDTATATTTYQADGVTYTRRVFASAGDQVIVIRLTADRPHSISFTAGFTTPYQPRVIAAHGDELTLQGQSGRDNNQPGQVKHETVVQVVANGGRVEDGDETLAVHDADDVTLIVDCRTNYVNYHDLSADPHALVRQDVDGAAGKSFDQLLDDHLKTYQPLFQRVSIDLGTTPAAHQPTDVRIKQFASGNDPALAALEFQFGRYLLISCSRPGGQPANLQGMWNAVMNPPWNGKYTVNINTEMNYWPAEKDNLSECAQPLFDLIKDVSVRGEETARVMYHAPGWVLHHNTDGWRATAPIDFATVGIWPTGGAWLLTHVWEHYLYTGDRQTLETFYPIFKGSCEFFLATLVEEPTHHWLVTCPSVSPEHGGLVAGPTMDESILRDLFQQTAEMSEILGVDPELRRQVLAARQRLAPFQIGKYGQLQEWLEDIDRQQDSHRHESHLYAMFPSAQITAETPQLFEAAKNSLRGRGDGATGWSLAWKLNLWARALDGNHAYLLLTHLLAEPEGEGPGAKPLPIDPKTGKPAKAPERRGGTYPNLFDAHPPFQIDGNFGATSGITEMLMQSHEGFIRILPALPNVWPTGSVHGIVARGGFVMNINWDRGKWTAVQVLSNLGRPCVIYAPQPFRVSDGNGAAVGCKRVGDDLYSFQTERGLRYQLTQ